MTTLWHYWLKTTTKPDILSQVNAELCTNYGITHLNGWIAGSKKTPNRVLNIIRKQIVIDELGRSQGRSLWNKLEME